MIDVEKLVLWLGPEGAKAGLQHSKLSVEELVGLARARKLPLSPKPTRDEVSNELAFAGIMKIEKKTEELLSLDENELLKYFEGCRPTRLEITTLLNELGIKASSEDKRNLPKFAAREISDIGLYQRVARGDKDRTKK